jgi:molybdopterin-containing oxidoreductase family iron-sulfur binding subunit
MTYNRCIRTRYCANDCPYKIRRFNWWTHKWGVMGERLVDRNPRALNPDVTVRTRGVMEKCNFCYQRLRDAKHRAMLRGSPLTDGEVVVACQQTCPTNAITFGNLHDQGSQISALRQDNRAYLALNGAPEHGHYGLKTWPNVSYLAEVTLTEPEADESHHG